MPRLPVGPSEIDQQKHNRFLDVLATEAEPLSQAMLAMGTAAVEFRRSGAAAAFSAAVDSMTEMSGRATTFLSCLVGTGCPAYLRGADAQIQDALKLLVDGGKRGADAARSGNGEGLLAAAAEMEVANEDIVKGASRIVDWRSGAARP